MNKKEIKDFICQSPGWINKTNWKRLSLRCNAPISLCKEVVRELKFKESIEEDVLKVQQGDLVNTGKVVKKKVWQLPNGETRESLTYISTPEQGIDLQQEFIKFIEGYIPPELKKIAFANVTDYKLPFGCLVFNHQDGHYDRVDVEGKNNIKHRFMDVYLKTYSTLEKAVLTHNLDKIIYVVGSDSMNSEWTGMTTKGTPQSNLMTHEEAFNQISSHHTDIIHLLKQYSTDVEIIYVEGNHDQMVGFYMVKFLQALFRDDLNVIVNSNTSPTKYLQYKDSLMMFNHGDAIKPEKLVSMFPIGAKDKWSSSEFFYIFTGDKHHQYSKDFNGIKFFQLPALANSSSAWEIKNGHCGSKPEMQTFLIQGQEGIKNIFCEIIK